MFDDLKLLLILHSLLRMSQKKMGTEMSTYRTNGTVSKVLGRGRT
jgi:hypothetical protein